ncbi:hypothetical protein ACH4CE_31465 [Streptomyces gelaticus]|uniref:hypothetical protein n=1 Tax=Streptomyces gelaticus TaxID=285446 RepID=UPI0037A4FB73
MSTRHGIAAHTAARLNSGNALLERSGPDSPGRTPPLHLAAAPRTNRSAAAAPVVSRTR